MTTDTQGSPSLQKLVGRQVTMKIPMMKDDGPIVAIVRSVEISGVWLECQEYTRDMLLELNVAWAPKTPILFVPFAQITCMIDYLDIPSQAMPVGN